MRRAALLALVLARGLRRRRRRPRRRRRRRRSPRLVDFSKKPPLVNTLDIDPANGDFLLTTNKGFWRIAHDGSKVTPIKGTITAQGKTDTVGTFLEIRSTGPNQLLGSGHPGHARQAPELPRAAALGRRRQDLERRLAARRRRPAQDRPRARPPVRVRRRPVGDADLERRRKDVHGGVHAARADDRLRGRPGQPGADHLLYRHRAVPDRGRRQVVAAAGGRRRDPARVARAGVALPRRQGRDDQGVGRRRDELARRRARGRRALRVARHRSEGLVSRVKRWIDPRDRQMEAPRGATGSGPDRRRRGAAGRCPGRPTRTRWSAWSAATRSTSRRTPRR